MVNHFEYHGAVHIRPAGDIWLFDIGIGLEEVLAALMGASHRPSLNRMRIQVDLLPK